MKLFKIIEMVLLSTQRQLIKAMDKKIFKILHSISLFISPSFCVYLQ